MQQMDQEGAAPGTRERATAGRVTARCRSCGAMEMPSGWRVGVACDEPISGRSVPRSGRRAPGGWMVMGGGLCSRDSIRHLSVEQRAGQVSTRGSSSSKTRSDTFP